MSCDNHLLHLTGAFIDLGYLGFPEIAFHIIFPGVSVSAVDLDGQIRYRACRFTAGELGHGRLGSKIAPPCPWLPQPGTKAGAMIQWMWPYLPNNSGWFEILSTDC